VHELSGGIETMVQIPRTLIEETKALSVALEVNGLSSFKKQTILLGNEERLDSSLWADRQAFTKGAFVEWLESNGGIIIILGSSFVIALLFVTMGFILFKKGVCASGASRRSHPGLANAPTGPHLDLASGHEGLQHYHQQMTLAAHSHQFDVITNGQHSDGGGGGQSAAELATQRLQAPPGVLHWKLHDNHKEVANLVSKVFTF
jgi:hypothetical protein